MTEYEKSKVTTSSDDSEAQTDLQFDFGIKNGMVIIDFGKSVRWIGLPPADAEAFAELLLKVAELVRRGHTEAKANLLFLDT